MHTKLFMALLSIGVLASCKKSTDVSGTVTSIRNKPVAGVTVTLGEDNTFKDKVAYSDKTTTDNLGHYKFSFSGKSNRDYFVTCLCDSGQQSSSTLELGKSNTADLHLQ